MTKTIKIQQYNLWHKLVTKRLPMDFVLEITARCNMNCRHCNINLPVLDKEAQNRELTTSQIMDISRQAADLGAVWVLLTGGEPLLRPDFNEIYMGLKRLGLLVSVFTNATLINDDHIELFKKYPPRDLEVTVYGVTKKTYETVTRKPGSFKKFIRGLDKLENSGVPVRLKAMATQSNFLEQPKIAAFCRDKSKDYYRFDPQLIMRYDGNPDKNEDIRAERLTPDQIIALEEADEKRISDLRNNCDKLINKHFENYNCDHLFHCGAGMRSFNVSYDGLFRLCPSLWAEGTTYNLMEGTLTEAWFDFVPNVRDMRSNRKEFLETCRRCHLVNLCLWCPAHAHLETGEMDRKILYFCDVAYKRKIIIEK